MDLSKYTKIIFDCDGVILDSNTIKSAAFEKCLVGEPQYLIERFIKYHHENGGISRYIKLKYYFSNIKKAKDYSDDLEKCLSRYSDICKKELRKAKLIPGVSDFLEKLKVQNIECLVSTGGDKLEVEDALREKKILYYFNKIYGNQSTKSDHLLEIQKDIKEKEKILFIGDSREDFEVSQKFNCDFLFIHSVSEWEGGQKIVSEARQYMTSDFQTLFLERV